MSNLIAKCVDLLIKTIIAAIAIYLVPCFIYWEFVSLTDAGIRFLTIFSLCIVICKELDKKK
jgi:hypothetical protein